MQYRAKVTVKALTGAGYFGYPIYLKLHIGGTLRVTTTLKTASPSQWSSAITYTSNWYTVENKTSGTTAVSFNIYSGSGSSRNSTYSYSMAIDPAASVLDVSNGTLGVAQTLNVTRYGDSFTHTITYVCGNDEGTICTKSSDTSVSWTPPIALAKNAPNGTAATIALTMTTYDGDTSIGTSTKTITAAIPSSVFPTVSLDVVDASGYLSTYGGYVQNKSTPKVTITAAGAQGSSIRNYATTIDGDTYTAAEFTAPALKGSGTLTVKTTVTDSRGRTATTSESISVLAYTAPKVSALTVQRCNANGTATSNGAYLKATFSASITSLSGKNTAAYKLQYKKTSETSYTSITLSDYAGSYNVSNGTYIFAADTAASYDVVLTATDAFSSATKGGAGSTVSKFFSWLAGGLGWAFGKVATRANAVEIESGWDFYAGGKIYDAYETLIGGGLAAYSGGGDAGIDPNTTLEELCLTSHTNAPQGAGTFYYIHTAFYNTKSATAARAQVAFPYNKSGSMYHRYYASGAWSAWNRYLTAAENPTPADYIVEQDAATSTDNIAWTYRKWSNGAAECWAKKNFGSVACTTAWGNIYQSANITAAFPTGLFSETPYHIDLSLLYGGKAGMVMQGHVTPTASGCTFIISRPSSTTFTNTTVGFHVIGRWK
jgi:hypothetical protein